MKALIEKLARVAGLYKKHDSAIRGHEALESTLREQIKRLENEVLYLRDMTDRLLIANGIHSVIRETDNGDTAQIDEKEKERQAKIRAGEVEAYGGD